MTPEQELSRSYEVQIILDNPIYKEAWTQIRDGIINAMNQSPIGDEKTHTKLVMALQIVNKLQGIMQNTMTTGKMAQIKLDEKKGLLSGLRRVV
jgi:hypothetical protein